MNASPPPAAGLAEPRNRLAVLLASWGEGRPVIWLEDGAELPEIIRDEALVLRLTELPAALPVEQARFTQAAAYLVRQVKGLLLLPAAHAQARVVRLGPPAEEGLLLQIFSNWPIPPLPQGLLERAPAAGGPAGSASEPLAIPSPDARLLSLAERLMAMEEKLAAAHLREAVLESRLSHSWTEAVPGGAFFDVPRERHGWPLAENETIVPAALGLYERRPDDAVILEARAGESFFIGWNLLAEDPLEADFAGARASLAALNPAPRLSPAPEVSIVIPVHGQLAYTLNCLHSLLHHKTGHTVEIIVVDDLSPDRTADHLSLIPHIHYHRRAQNGGFIAAANEGAARARGRYLVMLNNDTRVAPGWLDALIGSFAQFPKAGLAGSKLYYEDGSLQEAGGIIWRDGSCWNYGCQDDPNRPQYCHAREADYISGCSIAIRKDLWQELGGFDPFYAPAYCEDADLCLRLAERGYEIRFQPRSRVIHYEGKTSGTDTSTGVKSFQPINNKKLYMRWTERLLDHRPNGTAPYFERERKIKRRMLVVDAVAPTPNQDAGSVQTVLALKAAMELNYKVHFVPEDNFLFDTDAIPPLQAIGVDCAYAPYELGFENYLRRYGFLFDVILVYRVVILERTIGIIEKFAPSATLLYHVADLAHLRLARQAALENDRFLWEQSEKTRESELALARRAHATITHSRHEAALLAELAPTANVAVWPLAFDFFGAQAGFSARRDICFLGGYRHPPNVDAVKYFLAEIWPLIRAQLPEARFIIAGSNATAEVKALARPDVIVLGQVENLADLFEAARVCVVPLRVGAGVKGKVMTSLSYGVPVVSTAIGLEGTGLAPEEHVLQADTPADFAAQILRAYRDESLWRRLSESGQQIMRTQFSPAAAKDHLARTIESATRRRLGLDQLS